MAGVNVPLVSVQHQYLITERIDGVTPGLPTLRDPDRLTYYKEEVGGLVMGAYEPNPKPWAERGIPEGFAFTLLENDWDHFEPMMELALGRVPALEHAGVKQFINGPESFTPDGNFILGEAPEVDGFFVGAGFNAFGIASGGGAGMALAEWVATGAPPYDLWAVDIRRFGRNHLSTPWVRTRTLESYAKHYTMAWPSEEFASGRPLRRSPLYDRLAARGAVFGEKLGWERPNWFAGPGDEPRDIYTFERPNWFEAVGREHRACREAAALFDQTSFAKFLMVGRDAEAALSWICAGDVTRPPGTLVYTQMLNARGGIECDLTVARLEEDAYYIVTGTGFATHDFHWIRRNIPQGLDARLIDVTSQHAVLALMGPRAREILASVTEEDVSNAAFPFGRVRRLSVAGAPVIALRVTYVGELGWELHIPVEFAASVYDALMAAGARHGLSRRGLPRDRVAAAGEGLPRLGGGDRPGPLAPDGGPRLRREAARQCALPRTRRAGSATRAAAAAAAGGVHGRGPGGGAARPRDDLPRRPPGRLAGERRLGLHRGPRHRLWLRARPRERRHGGGCPGRHLRARGQHRTRPGRGLPPAPVRPRGGAGERLNPHGFSAAVQPMTFVPSPCPSAA